MLFKPIAFAATAAAMLVVPEVAPANGDGVFRALPIEVQALPASAFEQSVRVPCPQCRGRDSHLKMDFSIQDSTRLLLNGFELYPNADPWHDDLSAAVVRTDGKARERRLGYGLSVRPEGTDEQLRLELVSVELRIIEVGDRFIEGVAPVKIKLIRSLSGNIMIGSIDLMDGQNTQCTTAWCRFNKMIDSALRGLGSSVKSTFKGCGRHRKPHGMKPHHHKGHGKPEKGSGDKQGTDGHHRGELEFERPPRHSWGNMLKHVTSSIVFPVFLGLAAGVSVALIAMLLGTLTVRLVRFFKGGRRRCPHACRRKTRVTDPANIDTEKASLVALQEPYEDEPQN